MRLYFLCIVYIAISIPLEAYILYINSSVATGSYSWSATHSSKNWKQIIMTKTNGNVLYDRWIPVAFGLLVFIFFGFGKEAVSMYNAGLRAVGLGRLCACASRERIALSTGSANSWSSKARALLKRKRSSSTSTWIGGFTSSPSSTVTDTEVSKDVVYLNSIPEMSSAAEVSTGSRTDDGTR